MAKEFQYKLTIEEKHIDSYGHLNNAVYMQFFEEARWDYVNSNGFSMEYIKESGTGPVILEADLKFKRELVNHEKITIKSKVLSYEGKIAKLSQKMFKENGDLACDATYVFSFFDTVNRKIIDPTEKWLRAIGYLD